MDSPLVLLFLKIIQNLHNKLQVLLLHFNTKEVFKWHPQENIQNEQTQRGEKLYLQSNALECGSRKVGGFHPVIPFLRGQQEKKQRFPCHTPVSLLSPSPAGPRYACSL